VKDKRVQTECIVGAPLADTVQAETNETAKRAKTPWQRLAVRMRQLDLALEDITNLDRLLRELDQLGMLTGFTRDNVRELKNNCRVECEAKKPDTAAAAAIWDPLDLTLSHGADVCQDAQDAPTPPCGTCGRPTDVGESCSDCHQARCRKMREIYGLHEVQPWSLLDPWLRPFDLVASDDLALGGV